MADKLEGLSETANAEIKNRINSVLNEHGVKPTAFSKYFEGSENIQKRLSSQLSDDVAKPAKVSLEVVMLILNKYPDVSAEWLLRGKEQPKAQAGFGSVGDNSIANNNNTTVNDTEAIRYLAAQLEEKDRQIDRLLQLLERQQVG